MSALTIALIVLGGIAYLAFVLLIAGMCGTNSRAEHRAGYRPEEYES